MNMASSRQAVKSVTGRLGAVGTDVSCSTPLCPHYIYTTYGRFPAQLDAMNMCMWLQAHHLETAYYDHFIEPGSYHDAIAHHLHTWHAE